MMDEFTLDDLSEDALLRKMFIDPIFENTEDIFTNPISVADDAKALEVWQPIVVESRDNHKKNSLISVIETVIVAPDQGEWHVDSYFRQQIVLDEIGCSDTVADLVEDILFPEVGAERLTEKKVTGLSYLTPSHVVAARLNENLLTHCADYDVNEVEAVVFVIKYRGGREQAYFWHGARIVTSGSKKPLWLTVKGNSICNRTDDYRENDDWRLPDYRYPGFMATKSYYVWVNGLAYVISSTHVFTLRCRQGLLIDKNENSYGSAIDVEEGIYSVEYPSLRVIGKSKRGVDSAQVIKSALAAAVTTSRLISRYPDLAGEGKLLPKLEKCIRDFPDTRMLCIQYIGDGHALVRHKMDELNGVSCPKVVIGHTIYPAFLEDYQVARIQGELCTKRRKPHARQKVIMSNKLKIPMGVWFVLDK